MIHRSIDKRRPGELILRLLAIVALVTGAALSAGVPAQAAPPPATIRAACNTPSEATLAGHLPHARCYAVGWPDPSRKARTAADGPPTGSLTPADIQSAYQLPDAGAGMTVAIVDAFGYSTAEADLAVFRAHYGLPACTSDNGCFTKLDQRGGTDYPADDGGWSTETAIDLDAVSAACPKCDLLLVEGDSDDVGDLAQAAETAAQSHPAAISNSYGVDGEFPGEDTLDSYYDHPGIAVTVSSGDSSVQNWPSSDPDVVSIGGTVLTKDDSPRGWSETAWDSAGSGCSFYEPKPDFQKSIATGCDTRANADISAVAGTGLGIYNTLNDNGWASWGGTSLASPLVAAMYALAGTPTPGTYPNTYPYQNRDKLTDITTGANGNCGTAICQAGPGWDGPTGLGTPAGVSALTLGDSGAVSGKVTDATTGAAIGDAGIVATESNGDSYTATSAADGSYSLHAPVGTYDLSVTKFGFGEQKATGVAITKGSTVTKNFTLTAKPTKTISGHVTDGSGHGYPMRAKITVDGYPGGAVYSDPFTGLYSVGLPSGSTYQLHVTSADISGYVEQDSSVALSTDVRKDVALKVDTTACDAPGYAFKEEGTTQAFTGWKGATPQDGWTITDAQGNGQTWRFDNPGGWDAPPGGDADFAVVDSNAYGEGGKQDTSLVSPVIDMTGRDAPEIGFDTSYIGFPDQTGMVDLSLDGGTTWSTVQTLDGGVVDHVDIPVPQAADHDQVRVRFRYLGDWSRRWEIDDVVVGTRTCAPVSGGLVAGTITDANTGAPLDGATVTSDAAPAELGVTGDDGYYWLFSSKLGATPFTVTANRYATAHPKVTVREDGVRETDVALDAGHLTVGQSAVSTSMTLGAAKTQKLTFGNDGKVPVSVHLGEADAGVTPAVKGAAKQVVKTTTSIASMGKADSSALRQASPAAAPWTDLADYPLPVMDNAVAAHDGTVYVAGGMDGVNKLAIAGVYDPDANGWRRLPDMPEVLSAASAGFIGDTLYVTGGWNEDGTTNPHTYALKPDATSWTKLADLPSGVAAAGSAVVAGKLYVVGGCTTGSCLPVSGKAYSYDPNTDDWSAEPDYPAAAGYLACGNIGATVLCAGGTDGASSNKTFAYQPGSGGWTAKANLPVDAWGASGASANGRFEVLGGAINGGAAVTNQGFEFDLTTNTWSELPNSNNATYRGGAACGIVKVGGSGGGFNPVSFAESLPGYADCGGDVPWLSADKTDFAINPGKTVSVVVTTDSSAVTQPGTYDSLLTINTDSPYPASKPVAVTMTATPPAAWGKITGTVTANGKPVAGATVAVCTMYVTKTGTCGPTTVTLKTDAAGNYQLWLNKGYNPLQVIVAKDGFTPVMKIVKVEKGATVTTNVSLTANSSFNAAKVNSYLSDTMQNR
jgi:N-acetylneuraminic acid mutarotase